MSDQSVAVTITIAGENRASEALKKVESDTGRMASRLKDAADKSGDVERGFLGIKDIASAISPEAQRIADVAGGLEGLGKGLGALFGPVGIAIGLAAGAAALFYQHIKDGEQKAADAAIARIDALKETPRALARELGLSTDVLAVAKQVLSVDQARTEHARLLNATADRLKELKEAEKDADDELIAKATVKLSHAKAQTEALAAQLRVAQRLALIEAQRAAAASRESVERAAEDAEIARISDARGRITAETDVTLQRLRKTEQALAAARKAESDAQVDATRAFKYAAGPQQEAAAKALRAAAEDTKRLELERIAEENKLVALRRQSDQDDELQASKRRAAGQRAAAERKRQADEEAARQRKRMEWAEMEARDAEEWAKSALAIAQEQQRWDAKYAADKLASEDELRTVRAQTTEDPAERRRLELLAEEAQLNRELARLRDDYTMQEGTRANRLLAVQMRLTKNARDRKAVDEDAAKQRNAELLAGADLAKNTGSAIVEGLGQAGVAEKDLAGVRVFMAAAEGALAIARQGPAGIPQAIAAGFATVNYARAAGTTAPPMPPGVGGGAGGGAPGSGSLGMQPASGAARPVVINIMGGAYVGTTQQVAKHVGGVLKSLNGTGYSQYGGA